MWTKLRINSLLKIKSLPLLPIATPNNNPPPPHSYDRPSNLTINKRHVYKSNKKVYKPCRSWCSNGVYIFQNTTYLHSILKCFTHQLNYGYGTQSGKDATKSHKIAHVFILAEISGILHLSICKKKLRNTSLTIERTCVCLIMHISTFRQTVCGRHPCYGQGLDIQM